VKTARNVIIILALAAIIDLAPGGLTAQVTTSNILTVLFAGGMAFFAYRTYMERRTTLLDLSENHRLIVYGGAAMLAFALIATRRIWDTEGPLILLWIAMVMAPVYGFYVVFRQYREY
jgi:hypothetical protein